MTIICGSQIPRKYGPRTHYNRCGGCSKATASTTRPTIRPTMSEAMITPIDLRFVSKLLRKMGAKSRAQASDKYKA